jgi:hypothetical protein
LQPDGFTLIYPSFKIGRKVLAKMPLKGGNGAPSNHKGSFDAFIHFQGNDGVNGRFCTI